LLEEAYYCGRYVEETRNDNRLSQAVCQDDMVHLRLDYDYHISNLYGDSMDAK